MEPVKFQHVGDDYSIRFERSGDLLTMAAFKDGVRANCFTYSVPVDMGKDIVDQLVGTAIRDVKEGKGNAR